MGELGERFPVVLAEAARGDSAAFAELWRAVHPPLLRYLRVIAGDAAEDVASETWLKAMRGLSSFVGDEPAFRGWLTVIGRNVTRDLGRYAARRPETLLADPEPARHVTAPDAADQALERLGTERALRLLATLPPAQAEMVALRVVVGLERRRSPSSWAAARAPSGSPCTARSPRSRARSAERATSST